jgi:hypothetical protein
MHKFQLQSVKKLRAAISAPRREAGKPHPTLASADGCAPCSISPRFYPCPTSFLAARWARQLARRLEPPSPAEGPHSARRPTGSRKESLSPTLPGRSEPPRKEPILLLRIILRSSLLVPGRAFRLRLARRSRPHLGAARPKRTQHSRGNYLARCWSSSLILLLLGASCNRRSSCPALALPLRARGSANSHSPLRSMHPAHPSHTMKSSKSSYVLETYVDTVGARSTSRLLKNECNRTFQAHPSQREKLFDGGVFVHAMDTPGRHEPLTFPLYRCKSPAGPCRRAAPEEER